MALDALWAVLIPGVSEVSRVQAPVSAGLRDTPAVLSEVSEVSGTAGSEQGREVIGGIDPPDTPAENVRYQAQPAWALGCTRDTPDTPEKISADLETTEPAVPANESEPKRLFRQRGPWLTGRGHAAAQVYHLHHFRCHQCIAAGQGTRYARRCAVGLALWSDYTGADNLETEGGNYGQA